MTSAGRKVPSLENAQEDVMERSLDQAKPLDKRQICCSE